MTFKRFLKNNLPDKVYSLLKRRWRAITDSLAIASIEGALAEQGLSGLYSRLKEIVPDITHQYSSFKIDNEFYRVKVRALHSFQINLVERAIQMADAAKRNKGLRIVDIGDSAGTHLQYIKELWPEKGIRTLSVNLDRDAVERIKKKGLDAICSRAEDIKRYSANDEDILLSFEMLEHLMDPLRFIRRLSVDTNCRFFVVTVPYMRHSRLGLGRIRNNDKTEFNAENTHIFELSPEDWRLLFRFCGWRVEYEKNYRQYPRPDPFSIMKSCWRRFDYEGFYGAILVKDSEWSNLYKDWEVPNGITEEKIKC